jgi:nicotinamidase-related amidase
MGLPVVHVQHLSADKGSPLRPGQEGVEFITGTEPQFGERVFQKTVNSAFIGTHLDEYLKSKCIHSLVIAGLTTDHCVSTSVRMAANFGFRVFIVADCTATFNRKVINIVYSADVVQDLSLASLNGEFATIILKEEVESVVDALS